MNIKFLIEEKSDGQECIVLHLNKKAKLAVSSLDELRSMIHQLEKVLGEVEEMGRDEEDFNSGLTAFYTNL